MIQYLVQKLQFLSKMMKVLEEFFWCFINQILLRPVSIFHLLF